MENKDMKLLNAWDKKRKNGKLAYMFLNGILYPLIGITLWFVAEWYFKNQIIWQRIFYGSIPPWIALIIISIVSSSKRFDENERRYLAKYKINEK